MKGNEYNGKIQCPSGTDPNGEWIKKQRHRNGQRKRGDPMTTLYMYGDSFGADWRTDWQWHRQLVSRLNMNGADIQRVVNPQCVSGCPNDYSFDMFTPSDRQQRVIL